MLVLISFALVLVAAVLLVIGLLSEQMGLIYASIVCSALAGAVLVIATRAGRAKPLAAAVATPSASGPPMMGTTVEPVSVVPPAPPAPEWDREPEPVWDPVTESDPPAAPLPPPEMAPVPDPEPVAEMTAVVPAVARDDGDDFFPIADYEELSSAEILPLLPELYADELDDVEQRERAGLARTEILVRLMELKIAAEEEGVEGEPVPLVETVEDTTEVVAVDEAPVPAFPIAAYETLRVPEIRAQLTGLAPEDLATVRAHEAANANRKTVLEAIDRLSRAPVAKAVTKKAAAAKKGAVTNTAPRKAAAKKTTGAAKKAVKKSASAKKAAVAEEAAPLERAEPVETADPPPPAAATEDLPPVV